ncbi:UBX domain-containing protein 10 [Hoplias malabaricus]|uniref:UBX domain-containing protein 10 n=1 Tax=Hoplias malabaricus TaxID=27720 RepID=UPI003462B5BD
MHMPRPKSSKGRTRARVTQALVVDEGIHQSHMFSPHPPPPSPNVVPTHTGLRQSSKPSVDVHTETFERSPDVPVHSLNKYRVLPSIEKRPEEMASRLSVSDSSLQGHQLQREQHISHLCSRNASRSDPEMRAVSELHCGSASPGNTRTLSPGHSENRTTGEDTQLLLAIRTPCGQRFKCHFQPTDTLQAVVFAAEVKSGERYEEAQIETMEVPRRTFTDLTLSLSQCGVLNKSVLCISLEDSAMDLD